jgi:hypothetical protein
MSAAFVPPAASDQITSQELIAVLAVSYSFALCLNQENMISAKDPGSCRLESSRSKEVPAAFGEGFPRS